MVVKCHKVGDLGSRGTVFLGEYHHTLDAKKRLAIPAKIRKELGKKAVVTRGLDTSLFLYPTSSWERLAEKLMELPMGKEENRSFVRLMLAGARTVSLDAAGRILVPDYLVEYADLAKNVVVAGVLDRVEIWDEKRWASYTDRLEKRSNEIAEKLGEIGF